MFGLCLCVDMKLDTIYDFVRRLKALVLVLGNHFARFPAYSSGEGSPGPASVLWVGPANDGESDGILSASTSYIDWSMTAFMNFLPYILKT